MLLRRCLHGVAVLAVALTLPASARGQAAGGPQMTEPELEAYEMSTQLTFVCSPQRHASMPASESTIRRPAGPLEGTAAYLRSAEGTFLVLEGYNENAAGHCMVFAWFGGDLAPGAYEVRQLSMAAMEEEAGTDRHSFFTFSAVRAADESATLVSQGGFLRIDSVSSGAVSGSFELSGFTVNSEERVDGVRLAGAFTALAGDM